MGADGAQQTGTWLMNNVFNMPMYKDGKPAWKDEKWDNWCNAETSTTTTDVDGNAIAGITAKEANKEVYGPCPTAKEQDKMCDEWLLGYRFAVVANILSAMACSF